MLTTLLPWAALLLIVLALLSRDGMRTAAQPESKAENEKIGAHWWAAVLLALLGLGLGWALRDQLKQSWETFLGFSGGVAMACLALALSRLPRQPENGIAGPVAVGFFGAAIWTLFPQIEREPYQLGAAAGAGLGSWLLAGAPGGLWPARAGIMMALALVADVLGARAAGGHSAQAGSGFGLLVSVGLILALGLPRTESNANRQRGIGVAVGLAVLAGGSWLLASRHFFINDLWIIFLGSAGVGLVVGWLVPDGDEEQGSFHFMLSVIMWLAVATLSFGLRRGYGMSVATLGGAASLLALGRTRAMLTLGPLAAIAVYRIFREMHSEASRALDIGQHYALIGLAVGAMLPVLVSEWRASTRSLRSGAAWAGALWCPMLLAVPFVSGVVLAGKGYVGVLAGTGLGTVIEGLKPGSRLETLSLQLGLSVALIAGYEWIADKLNLARAEKISTLVWVAVGLAILALAIGWLSRLGRERSAGSTA